MPRSAHSDINEDVFVQGSLYLARDSSRMRLTAWPVPRAVRLRGHGFPWEPFLPEFRVVHPYRAKRKKLRETKVPKEQLAFDFFAETYDEKRNERLTEAEKRKRAFDEFRFSMPKTVARVLEPFRTHQWPLLVLLAHDEAALDLAQGNPALAYALAQRLKGDADLIQSLRCSTMRQRELLDILGLPSSPKVVKVFRKIAPESVNGDNWDSLIRVIRQESQQVKSPLYHLPAINSGVVEILLDPVASRAAQPTLLEEVSNDMAEKYRGRIVHLITSTLQMQDELRNPDWARTFPSVERLREVHSEVLDHYRRRMRQLSDANAHDTDQFRHPPIPGIPGKIEPVTSAKDLVNEGEEQGNCVASYASRVRDGTTFIYRVMEPERATLSIVKRAHFDEWQIGELESKYNTDVKAETEEYVEAWLSRHRSFV